MEADLLKKLYFSPTALEKNAKGRAPHPLQQTFQFASPFVIAHQVILKCILIIFSPPVPPSRSSKTYAVCCLSRWVM